MQIFKNECSQFVYIDFGLVILGSAAVARLAVSASLPLTLLAFSSDDIAHLRFAISLPDVLAFAMIVAEFVFIKRANRHLNGSLSVGKDDRFI